MNFEEIFPVVGADLGFSADEITGLTDDSQMLRYAILNGQTAAAFSKTCTGFKNAMLGGVDENVESPKVPVYNGITAPRTLVEAGVLDRLSKALQRAKLSSKFNQAIAEQLLIAAATPDNSIPDDAKPTAGGTAMTGSVVPLCKAPLIDTISDYSFWVNELLPKTRPL